MGRPHRLVGAAVTVWKARGVGDALRDLLVRIVPVLVALAAVVALVWLFAGRVDDPRIDLPREAPVTAPAP